MINLMLDDEGIGAPIGETYRKYHKPWNALLRSIVIFGHGSLAYENDFVDDSEEEQAFFRANDAKLKAEGLRDKIRVTKKNLKLVFGGTIYDWDYLLKVLEAFKHAKYHEREDSLIDYSEETDGSIIIYVKV